MSQHQKILLRILSGTSDRNILFNDLTGLLEKLGFSCRIKGDHFIFTKDGIEEIINIQPRGDKAKAYQVKQIRMIILSNQLGVYEHE